MGRGEGLRSFAVGSLVQVPHPPWDLGSSSSSRELDPQREQPVTGPGFLFLSGNHYAQALLLIKGNTVPGISLEEAPTVHESHSLRNTKV